MVKTCTARVLDLPTHSREIRKVGGRRDGGVKGAGETRNKDLWFNL